MNQEKLNDRENNVVCSHCTSFFSSFLGLVFFSLGCSFAHGGIFTIAPRVTIGETYTDNVTLEISTLEKEDYVTELTPGVTLNANSSRLNGVLDYQIQNLTYAKESNYNATNHQLEGGLNAEIMRNHLFLDVEAGIDQHNVSPETTSPALDNINFGGREDVKTLRVSPYYQHNFGGNLNTLLRYTYNATRYEAGTSDSDSDALDMYIGSEREYAKLKWNINYYKEKVDRETASDVQYENADVEIEYLVTRYLGAILRAGREDNDLQLLQGENNGSYAAGGFSWQPDRKYRFRFLYGDRYKSINGTWSPTQRTSLDINWYDRDVGLNTGVSWDGVFAHHTRHGLWQASYLEETTTIQQVQSESGVTTDSETGDISIDPDNTLESGGGNRLTNDVFLRKRAEISFDLDTRKSDMNFLAFSEKREFQLVTGTETEKTNGSSFSWDWEFINHLNLLIDTGWRGTTYRTTNRKDDLRYYEIGLSKNLRKIVASIKYRNTNLDSTDNNAEYDENRIALYLDASF